MGFLLWTFFHKRAFSSSRLFTHGGISEKRPRGWKSSCLCPSPVSSTGTPSKVPCKTGVEEWVRGREGLTGHVRKVPRLFECRRSTSGMWGPPGIYVDDTEGGTRPQFPSPGLAEVNFGTKRLS